MEFAMSLIIGVGLSAACGFRVFVPLLGMSIAAMAGHLSLSPGFEWIGTWPALIAFATATALEVTAYFVPWLDNLMDVAATPAAIIAGTIVTASQIGEASSPLLKWTLAVIAGGGTCGLIQAGTVAARAVSTGTTGGFGNFIVSTLELVFAVVLTAFVLMAPVLALLGVIGIMAIAVRKIAQWREQRTTRPNATGLIGNA